MDFSAILNRVFTASTLSTLVGALALGGCPLVAGSGCQAPVDDQIAMINQVVDTFQKAGLEVEVDAEIDRPASVGQRLDFYLDTGIRAKVRARAQFDEPEAESPSDATPEPNGE